MLWRIRAAGIWIQCENLISNLCGILKLNKNRKAIIIGIGHIGHALINNFDFAASGFELIGAFDITPELIGTKIRGIEIFHVDKMDEFIGKYRPEIAVMTLPKSKASMTAICYAKPVYAGFGILRTSTLRRTRLRYLWRTSTFPKA